MLHQPFSILKPFSDRVEIMFFDKHDDLSEDDTLATLLQRDAVAAATQVHGGRTVIVDAPISRSDEDADALVTNTVGLPLSIRSADCQTFVFYDPATHSAGVAHAGWQGLLKDMIPSCIRLLVETYNCDPANLLVGVGPSLCQSCSDFTNPTTELPGIDPTFFNGNCIDLQGIADAQLVAAGIVPEHIERMPDCTRCKPEHYFSYRAEPEHVKAHKRNVLTCTLL